MQIYKYCHCLLFVTPEGKPVTEYLPIDHDGRKTYGVVRDPTPKPRTPLRDMAEKTRRRTEILLDPNRQRACHI